MSIDSCREGDKKRRKRVIIRALGPETEGNHYYQVRLGPTCKASQAGLAWIPPSIIHISLPFLASSIVGALTNLP